MHLALQEQEGFHGWYSLCKSPIYILYLELFHSQVSFPHWGEAGTVLGFPTVQRDLQRKSVSLRGEVGLPQKQGLFNLFKVEVGESGHYSGTEEISQTCFVDPVSHLGLCPSVENGSGIMQHFYSFLSTSAEGKRNFSKSPGQQESLFQMVETHLGNI